MALQFIHDNKGNATGVFIPIEDWEILKNRYSDLQIEEIQINTDLSNWQKQIIDERLKNYYNNPNESIDFNQTLNAIEKSI